MTLELETIIFILRWTARIWSGVIIALTLFIFIAHVLYPDTEEGYPKIEILMPISMLISVFGLCLAFFWELVGALINIFFFLLNWALYRVINGRYFPAKGLAVLSLALIPGILFLLCWVLSL